MYASPRHVVRGSPYRSNPIPEGPIQDFATIIENTQPEDWQRRTSALTALVNTIPSGSDYSNGQAWYNSPPILRHLALPLSALLSDARSTVVKRTCECCSDLFAKCQSDARYLLKDIMPTILAVHAQTVQVIRTYVQNMTIETLSVVPCKMCMPMWLDRLKSDKSRTVREACCLYLGVGLSEWTEPGYLTKEIWIQVGTALIKALRDSTPGVRNYARRGVETVFHQQPTIFEKLFQDAELTRDQRVKKLLLKIQNGEVLADDVSVASSRVGSVASRSVRSGRVGSVVGRNTKSPSYLRSAPRGGGGGSGSVSTTTSRSIGIPKTIGVATTSSYGSSPAASRSNNNTNNETSRPRGLGPPIRMTAPFKSTVESPPKISRRTSEEPPALGTPTNGAPHSPITADKALGASFDTADTAESELPVIANTKELREVAKSRNSRRSSLLLERMTRSSSNVVSDAPGLALGDSHDSLLDDILDEVDIGDHMILPEHTKIAHAILEAHKAHVDQIMETLKVEMDALKEFELVLLEEGPRRPTEDEVLEYFESVGLCLEQRSKAGSNLQKKMDRISKGAE